MIEIVDLWIANQTFFLVAIFPSSNGTAIEYLQSKGVKIVSSYSRLNTVPYPRKILQFLVYPLRAYRWLIGYYTTITMLTRKLTALKVDLVYTNTSTSHVGAWLKKSLKVPHVWHFREFGEENLDFTRIWGNRQFYQTVNKYSDSIVVISEALRTKVEKYSSLPIHVIYDDLSPTYINPKESIDLQNRPLKLLIAGTLSVGKGQIQAIKAVNELKQRGFDIVLYIAGTGSEEENLKTYTQTHNLSSNIVFLGLVKDMNELRNQMDVGIVCSRCEAFGRITIEGMLSNMVMIGANTGGTPELIQDGKTGFLYRWNDISDLEEKIEYIYINSTVAERISRQGFEFGLEFTKGKCAKDCKALMMKCIEESKAIKSKKYFEIQPK